MLIGVELSFVSYRSNYSLLYWHFNIQTIILALIILVLKWVNQQLFAWYLVSPENFRSSKTLSSFDNPRVVQVLLNSKKSHPPTTGLPQGPSLSVLQAGGLSNQFWYCWQNIIWRYIFRFIKDQIFNHTNFQHQTSRQYI